MLTKKFFFILILFNITIFAKTDINILSWKMSDDIFYDNNLKFKLNKYLNNINADIIVFQNLKKKLNLNLDNKYNIFIKNNYNYYNNSFYSFYINKKYFMADVYQYPDYFNIWQFPPVMLYIPKLNLAIISICVNNNFSASISLTNSPYTFIKANVYDIKNVLKFFMKRNIDINNIIITGDFGLDDIIIKNILHYPVLLKDKKITIQNHNYGNYNYNVISFIKSISVKILNNTNISNYYPIMIKY